MDDVIKTVSKTFASPDASIWSSLTVPIESHGVVGPKKKRKKNYPEFNPYNSVGIMCSCEIGRGLWT